MSTRHVKYLLVGGGVASISAAEAIRAIDAQGELMMVAQEVYRPYHRPPLSKEFLRRQTTHESLFTHPAGWYEENHIQLRSAHRAARLDTSRATVTLNNGEEISFDRLLIATGVSSRHLNIPGAEMPNLFYIRTIEDAQRLHHALDQFERMRRAARVAVIGGGLLGVELAASLAQMGLVVELVVAGAHPWARFAGESAGRLVAHHLRNSGVAVHCGPRPVRLEGDGRVQRVALSDGRTIACDIAISAVGVTTNKELLRGSAVTAEKAILTDERCRTNVEGIYAAGDCAAVFDPLFGKHRVMDHYDSAALTGKIAGTNMAGGEARYEALSGFGSDLPGLRMRGWGEARLVDRRVVRMTGEKSLVEFGIAADGRVAQVVAVNDAGDEGELSELVRRRVDVSGREDELREPGGGIAGLGR